MKTIIAFLSSLIYFLPNWLFGVRVAGEKLSEPTFTTTLPSNPLSENDWYQALGVSKEWKDKEPILRARWLMSQWGENWKGVAK